MGVVDLVGQKAILWNDSDKGVSYQTKDIPEGMQAECSRWRHLMIEAAAEANEHLMDKYLESETLSEDEIRQGLRLRTLANEVVPVLCGSAF